MKLFSILSSSVLCSLLVACSPSMKGDFSYNDLKTDQGFVYYDEEKSGLSLDCQSSTKNGAQLYDVVLDELTGKDRSVILSYSFELPIEGNLQWLEGQTKDRQLDTTMSLHVVNGDSHTLSFNNGDVGYCDSPLSRYPFAAVTDGEKGYGIGIDMAYPAVFRVGYDGPSNRMFISYDLGLVPEQENVKLRFCVFEFDPVPGFEQRSALQRYYEIFPEAFATKLPSPNQGIWIPTGKVKDIEGWEDFGIRFMESTDDAKFDDAHDILTLRYVEPLSCWFSMSKDLLPKREEGMSLADYNKLCYPYIMEEVDRRSESDPGLQRLHTSVYENVDGTPYFGVTDMPWCVGALFGLNSMPGIEGEYTDFNVKWGKDFQDQWFGHPEETGVIDGMYIDSAEGFVGYLDFSRNHFKGAATPITFDRTYRKPAIFRGLITFEFIRAIAEDMHSKGKYMMANQPGSEVCFLLPLLDISGTETNWFLHGSWEPMPLEDMFYRRAMSYQKPYCFLQNTNFEYLTPEYMEKYMKRSVAFAMSPGCFSHNAADDQYFHNPALYNRDRELFKKYVPMCVTLSEAGWIPVTMAVANDEKIHIERYGDSYLSILNDSRESRTFEVELQENFGTRCKDLITGKVYEWADGKAEFTLSGDDVLILEFMK